MIRRKCKYGRRVKGKCPPKKVRRSKCKYGRRVKGKCPAKTKTEKRRSKIKSGMSRLKFTPKERERFERWLAKRYAADAAEKARRAAQGYVLDIDR